MVNGKTIDGVDLAARIPAPWHGPTQAIARILGDAGHRAWVVGGTVRDLILDRPVKDVDIVSDAAPERVESLFEKTIPVGKAFGIIVVVMEGLEFEVATFREETGYSDQRRPDSIRYATNAAADARRRDFTCNALFLDPLDGTIEDPTGGLRDLMMRQLRAVGEPADRFREDGLRLLRMARFSAALGLEPAPGLLEAAEAEAGSLVGVSPERVLGELEKILAGGAAARAITLLEGAGLAALCMPGWDGTGLDQGERERRVRMLEQLDGPIPSATGLAVLFGDSSPEITKERVQALRASKDLRESASTLWAHSLQLESWAHDSSTADESKGEDPEERGRRALTARIPATAPALVIASARAAADGASTEPMESLRAELERRDHEAPAEPFELPSARLMELGVPRGPALGHAIARMRAASMGSAFTDAAGAEAWLRTSGLLK